MIFRKCVVYARQCLQNCVLVGVVMISVKEVLGVIPLTQSSNRHNVASSVQFTGGWGCANAGRGSRGAWGLAIIYLAVTEALDWAGRFDYMQTHFPRLLKWSEHKRWRVVLAFVGLCFLG